MKRWQWIVVISLSVAGQAAGSTAGSSPGKPKAAADARLLRKVTVHEKGAALSDFCAEMQAQTGVELTASRAVADEKVTVFVEERPAREVMREVARLFGFFWQRSGHEGGYRYELDQDLRSRLAEEELRNHDRDAALLALDAEMENYRPYLGMSFDEVKKRWDQASETEKSHSWDAADSGRRRALRNLVPGGVWGPVQLYFRLTPRDRAALVAGQDLIFRRDSSNPERHIPPELASSILQSMGDFWQNGHPAPLANVPDIQLDQVALWLQRSEVGRISLKASLTAYAHPGPGPVPGESMQRDVATARSSFVADPANSIANRALRGCAPFNQGVALKPKPSFQPQKPISLADLDFRFDFASSDLDVSKPYLLSADVWEAVHRASGLPIVADFYTHLYPVGKLTVEGRPLFDALCAVGDTLSSRWAKDGDYLMCRSTGYYWAKLEEVPNRYLERWAKDRQANGGLPLSDFLEMAAMSDQQLDSEPVAQAIEHLWGLREWAFLHPFQDQRQYARLLAILTPEQLRRSLEPKGLPFTDLTGTQKQSLLEIQYQKQQAQQRDGLLWLPTMRPEELARAQLSAIYIPDGWYMALVPPPGASQPWNGPVDRVGGRTAADAAAKARRLHPQSTPSQVRLARDGYFYAEFAGH